MGVAANDRVAQMMMLQRSAGNRAVVAALRQAASPTVVQRCGSVPCDCTPEERAVANEPPPDRTAVQRLHPDFTITGRPADAKNHEDSIFFDRDSDVVAADEDAKLAKFKPFSLSSLQLKGLVSEDETSPLAVANGRIGAVATRLKAQRPTDSGTPVPLPDLTSGKGQPDYRRMRQVEVLAPAASSAVDHCDAGADIDCGPSPNAFDKGVTVAITTLLPVAFHALAAPSTSPAKEALTLFGGPAQAGNVKAGLTKTKAQLPNLAPVIPLNDDSAPGHRCINSCEGDVLAYSEKSGAAARITLGPRYLSADPIHQGLTIIHEASHSATGLTTGDNTYDWQRLLPFLTPAAALQNADSYTRFVELIHDPAAAPKGMVDDPSSLPTARRNPALEALAWLEQWLVQGRLQTRALYKAVSHATAGHAWRPSDIGYYRDFAMKRAAIRFGVTAPPAVPTPDDQAIIAGVLDRLAAVRFAVTGEGRTLQAAGSTPTSWTFGPGQTIAFSNGFFSLGKKARVEVLLKLVMLAAPGVPSSREAAYVAFVKDLAVDFGGP